MEHPGSRPPPLHPPPPQPTVPCCPTRLLPLFYPLHPLLRSCPHPPPLSPQMLYEPWMRCAPHADSADLQLRPATIETSLTPHHVHRDLPRPHPPPFRWRFLPPSTPSRESTNPSLRRQLGEGTPRSGYGTPRSGSATRQNAHCGLIRGDSDPSGWSVHRRGLSSWNPPGADWRGPEGRDRM